MKDRYVPGIAFLAATVIVCGGSFIIAAKGGDILEGSSVAIPARTNPSSQPPARPAPLPLPNPRVDRPLTPPPTTYAVPEAPRRAQSGVYRCTEKGTVVYSDQPCLNGREVDVRPNGGFQSTPVLRPAPQPRSYTEEPAPAGRPVARTDAAPSGVSQDGLRAARCAAIDAEIAQIDAMARAGGSATYQDWLRARRHKLVDEKYELKC